LLAKIAVLAEKIAGLDADMRKRVTRDGATMRLATTPGVAAVTAAAITTRAPPMETVSGAGTSLPGSASRHDNI
jgi:transposase